MNKIFSVLVLTSMASLSAQAIEVKRRIYRKEVTQKLQETLNAFENEQITTFDDFLTSVDQLITKGADPNIKSQKTNTPLLLFLVGALLGHPDKDDPLFNKVIQDALSYRADPNVQDDRGNTPLDYVITFGTVSMAQLLVDHGADLSPKKGTGETPLASLEKWLKNRKDMAHDLQNQTSPDAIAMIQILQKDIGRLEQIGEILKAAEQKK